MFPKKVFWRSTSDPGAVNAAAVGVTPSSGIADRASGIGPGVAAAPARHAVRPSVLPSSVSAPSL